jgi:hypothetical protein
MPTDSQTASGSKTMYWAGWTMNLSSATFSSGPMSGSWRGAGSTCATTGCAPSFPCVAPQAPDHTAGSTTYEIVAGELHLEDAGRAARSCVAFSPRKSSGRSLALRLTSCLRAPMRSMCNCSVLVEPTLARQSSTATGTGDYKRNGIRPIIQTKCSLRTFSSTQGVNPPNRTMTDNMGKRCGSHSTG